MNLHRNRETRAAEYTNKAGANDFTPANDYAKQNAIMYKICKTRCTAQIFSKSYINGYFAVSSSTIALALGTPASPSLTTNAMASAMRSISSVFIPRDVTAGVPRRMPLVTKGF